MRSSTFMGAVCAGLLGLYIGVSHIGAPITVPVERMTLAPTTTTELGTVTVPDSNAPAAASPKTVNAPSSNRFRGTAKADAHPTNGGVTPTSTVTEATATPTVVARTVSLTTVTPEPVTPAPASPKPVTQKPVTKKPVVHRPPAPKPDPTPVVQPPVVQPPVPPTVTPPPVVPPKDGIDGGHDGVDLGEHHGDDDGDSCHHRDDRKDEHGHDGYDSSNGTSHGDGQSASDGNDHRPKHGDPPKAETGHINVDASVSLSLEGG